MNTQHDTPSTPDPTVAPDGPGAAEQPAAPATTNRPWRQRLTSRRAAVAAGAAAIGLAIGGLGFAAGYAVADPDADQPGITQLRPGTPPGGDGFRGPDGGMGGPMDDQQDGEASGQYPDFDGDGLPDDGSAGSGQDSGQDTAQQS